jgi:hypothetical protein
LYQSISQWRPNVSASSVTKADIGAGAGRIETQGSFAGTDGFCEIVENNPLQSIT